MPANLTPDYFKAEKWFKEAQTTEEKILALEKMLAVIPKHKGTSHMCADIKKKISHFKDSASKKSGTGKTFDIFHIPKSGAAQIVMIGTPNSGKSSIVASLTNANVTVAEYPHSTSVPAPGMVTFEDIKIQLVDMPPITADYAAPGQVGTYRNCDKIAITIDLSTDLQEQLNVCFAFLNDHCLLIDKDNDQTDAEGNALGKDAFFLCTKNDAAPADAIETLKSLSPKDLPMIVTSTESFEGIEELPENLFAQSGKIRVYTKKPKVKAELKDPFTLPIGSTVMDLARTIHRELAEKFKSARIWGKGYYDGQNAPQNHILNDKDIIELHFK